MAPILIAGAFGCAAGLATNAVSDSLSDNETNAGGKALSCVAGSILGAGASALRSGIVAAKAK